MEQHTVCFAWEEDFPPVFGHTSIAFLKKCPGFYDAKNGDLRAAIAVVTLCVKPGRIRELRDKYPTAVLLPVCSDNKLPEALARVIGLRIHLGVREVRTITRKELSAMERLLHKPCFRGQIASGERYILVDDVVTQGGTVSALRQFVLVRGGLVIAITALTYSAGSRIIAPTPASILSLIDRFDPVSIIELLRVYDIVGNFWELTNSQARYLLRFRGIEGITREINRCLRPAA